MDKITKSLQSYLKKNGIKFKSMFDADTRSRLEEQTSTVFHITRKIDEVKMAVIIDIYPKDQYVFLSILPFFVFSDDKMSELKAVENKWNRTGTFSTLSIEEERGVIEAYKYCFKLSSWILAENNGLSHQLWKKYLELIIEETLDAWEMFEKILNPDIFEILPLLSFENGTDATLHSYRFN